MLNFSFSKKEDTGQKSAPQRGFHMKQTESQLQDQDNTSTLSTGQSDHTVAAMTPSNCHMPKVGPQPGYAEIHERQMKDCSIKPSQPHLDEDCTIHQGQLDFSQSMGCLSWTEPYLGRLVATYGPNGIIYPQMVGIVPARMPLPSECAESIPIYVNAKQYRAILRRREIRAKLEAENKVVKVRKAYLHESRHVHALKRARGSGGRFLNKNELQQLKSAASPTHGKTNTSNQKGGGDISAGSQLQHSESGSWGTSSSTPSGSDVTSIFSGDGIFQQPEFRVSRSPYHMGVSMHEAENFVRRRT
ncbi:PREDICTED: nuclear transcription factor Y subunit A-3-like isoform X2 [Ipomoea nil]|uniref:nuclear transcription factor Y subunit A-3-like isoform X2 n=1 Tax=Ipomoea nil TaxID=35883 RepID=UPI000900F7F8|nr:PREDICTED: nuclear transcription factor Y subunit A-3-like isoform X2 [Ipomoea nil]